MIRFAAIALSFLLWTPGDSRLAIAERAAASRLFAATGLILRFDDIAWVQSPLVCAGKSAVACYFSDGSVTISAELGPYPKRLEDVVLHEGIHTFACAGDAPCEHLEPHQGIMTAREDLSPPCLTPADLRLLCARAPCVWRRPECGLTAPEL